MIFVLGRGRGHVDETWIGCLLYAPDRGLNLRPEYVPRPGIGDISCCSSDISCYYCQHYFAVPAIGGGLWVLTLQWVYGMPRPRPTS